jgi:hypothetical protein
VPSAKLKPKMQTLCLFGLDAEEPGLLGTRQASGIAELDGVK